MHKAFLQDPLALSLTQEAINAKADQQLSTEQKIFLYMPFMHSESIVIHDQAEVLFSQMGLEYTLKFNMRIVILFCALAANRIVMPF